jgi:hypothetical protein
MVRLFRDIAWPAALLAVPVLSIAGCAAPEVTADGVELIDPAGLIEDILGSGHPIRLYVVPTATYACDPGTGVVAGFPLDDLEPGMFADAVVDVSVDASAHVDVTVPVGDWTIVVRGKGTDPVTGVMNAFIGRGCSTATVGNGETLAVTVQLVQIVGEGDCMDTVLSPDEQCFPANTASCNATCQTIQQPVNTTHVTGTQDHPRVSTAPGRRAAVTFDDDRTDVALRMYEASGVPVPIGAASRDDDLSAIGMGIPGTQLTGAPAMASDGHFAIALVDYTPAQSDVYVFFYTVDRNVVSHTPLLTDMTGTQASPSPAFSGSGALLVAFADSASATGVSARVFAAGAMTPTGTTPIVVGAGATAGDLPIVAGLPSGFVVVFESGTDIRFQRLDAAGAPTDAMARTVDDAAATRSTPVVAARADGSFLIAWVEEMGGPTIRARAFGADGTPTGATTTVSTTSGALSLPSVAAGVDNYLVAWQAGGAVRARVLSSGGVGILNREHPPTTNDFEVTSVGANPSVAAIGETGTLKWLVVFDAAGDVFSRLYPR